MSMTTFKKWDLAEHIQNVDDAVFYIQDALQTGNLEMILSTLDCVSRSVGMKNLSEKMGVNLNSLYRSFNKETDPKFSTILKLFNALGLVLNIQKAETSM